MTFQSNADQEIWFYADGEAWTESRVVLRGVEPGRYRVAFRVEGCQPYRLRNVRLHQGRDVMVQGYEGGAVVMNPSLAPVTVDLGELVPGESFRRINRQQDPATNDGRPIGNRVRVPALDALFLHKRR